jgi:uncharacterized protein (TIRG00374 family)
VRKTSGRGKQLFRAIFVLALTAFFLWLFLRNANLQAVGSILRSASPAWLTAAVIVNIFALLFRTIRWRTLLDPDDPPPFYATFFANTIGYMASSLLPIRASDFARSALLARRTVHRFSGAIGTVLAERVLDLGSILLLFVYFALRRRGELTSNPQTAQWFNYLVVPAAIVASVILAALTTLMISVYFFGSRIRRWHEALGRFVPTRFRSSWMHFFDTFAATLEILHHRSALRTVLLSTVGVWACLSGQIYLSAKALRLALPFDASFFITGASTIGLAVPTPGGVGGIHKVCQFILTRFYLMKNEPAVAAAVLFHLVGTVPVVVIGVALFAREGLHWRDLSGGDERGIEN